MPGQDGDLIGQSTIPITRQLTAGQAVTVDVGPQKVADGRGHRKRR